MDRVTSTQLTNATQYISDRFAGLGIVAPSYFPADSTLILQKGSQTYGRAYRLMWQDPTTGGLAGALPGEGYLGMSARDALNVLNAMRATLDLLP